MSEMILSRGSAFHVISNACCSNFGEFLHYGSTQIDFSFQPGKTSRKVCPSRPDGAQGKAKPGWEKGLVPEVGQRRFQRLSPKEV